MRFPFQYEFYLVVYNKKTSIKGQHRFPLYLSFLWVITAFEAKICPKYSKARGISLYMLFIRKICIRKLASKTQKTFRNCFEGISSHAWAVSFKTADFSKSFLKVIKLSGFYLFFCFRFLPVSLIKKMKFILSVKPN